MLLTLICPPCSLSRFPQKCTGQCPVPENELRFPRHDRIYQKHPFCCSGPHSYSKITYPKIDPIIFNVHIDLDFMRPQARYLMVLVRKLMITCSIRDFDPR